MTAIAIVAVFVTALAAIAFGLAGLAVLSSHVTDTAEYEGDDATIDELLDSDRDEVLARAERAGERAAIYIRVRQGIDARSGPGRHRAPEAAPSWVLNTQEIDAKWHAIVSRETVVAR